MVAKWMAIAGVLFTCYQSTSFRSLQPLTSLEAEADKLASDSERLSQSEILDRIDQWKNIDDSGRKWMKRIIENTKNLTVDVAMEFAGIMFAAGDFPGSLMPLHAQVMKIWRNYCAANGRVSASGEDDEDETILEEMSYILSQQPKNVEDEVLQLAFLSEEMKRTELSNAILASKFISEHDRSWLVSLCKQMAELAVIWNIKRADEDFVRRFVGRGRQFPDPLEDSFVSIIVNYLNADFDQHEFPLVENSGRFKTGDLRNLNFAAIDVSRACYIGDKKSVRDVVARVNNKYGEHGIEYLCKKLSKWQPVIEEAFDADEWNFA